MKKISIIIAVAAALLAAAPQANAQSLLEKARQKAEQAAAKAAEKISGSSVGQSLGSLLGNASEESSNASQSSEQDQVTQAVKGTDVLQKQRKGKLSWSDPVTPSTASLPIPLLNEFPAVPSASQLINPVEDEQIAYYQAIKKVVLRAEQLNSELIDDDFAIKQREKYNNAICEIYGITPAELEALESSTISDAERERIEDKIRANLLGGLDTDDLQTSIEGAQDRMKAVIAKYEKPMSEMSGITVEEYRLVMDDATSAKERERIEKKQEAYVIQKSQEDPSFAQRYQELNMNFQQEMMSVSGLGTLHSINDMMNNIAARTADALGDINALQQQAVELMESGYEIEEALDLDGYKAAQKVSSKDIKRLEELKKLILASNDPAEYGKYYDEAETIMKTYRERAAEAWSNELQTRFNKVKASMPAYLKAQRNAAQQELIPEAAVNRGPLNMVIKTGEMLDRAYTSFDDIKFNIFDKAVQYSISLSSYENEGFWEIGGFAGGQGLVDFLDYKWFYKVDNNTGVVSRYEGNGKWTAMPKDFKLEQPKQKPAKSEWTSADGKRTVIYNPSLSEIILPDGTICRALAAEKQGNDVVWVDYETEELEDGSNVSLIKCTYKL